MIFGFLFKSKDLSYPEAFRYIGFIAIGVAAIVFLTRFAKSTPETRFSPDLKPTLQ